MTEYFLTKLRYSVVVGLSVVVMAATEVHAGFFGEILNQCAQLFTTPDHRDAHFRAQLTHLLEQAGVTPLESKAFVVKLGVGNSANAVFLLTGMSREEVVALWREDQELLREVIQDQSKVPEFFPFIRSSFSPELRKTWSASVTVQYEAFRRMRTAATDPYSLGYDLFVAAQKSKEKLYLDLLSLESFLALDWSKAEVVVQLIDWIRSEAHALYFYSRAEHLLVQKPMVLDILMVKNKFLKGLFKSPDGAPGLVTFGFEKEGSTPNIALYYRNPKTPDEVWLDLKEAERMTRLKALVQQKKYFHSAAVIAPTQLKPLFLGGYSEELETEWSPQFAWEVKHKAFELSFRRLLQELRELTKDIGHTHSIHVHAAFYFPTKDGQGEVFQKFIRWVKYVNDYLNLKGLEEGLQPDRLSGVAQLPGERSYRSLKLPNNVDYLLPRDLASIDEDTYKFLSMGLRARIYGKSEAKGFQKIGFELRDVSRDMDRLEGILSQVAESISLAVWSRLGAFAADAPLIRIQSENEVSERQLVAAGVPLEVAKVFVGAHPLVALPFQNLEQQPRWDWRTGAPIKTDVAYQKTYQTGVEFYRSEIVKLVADYRNQVTKNGKVDPEELKIAISWCLVAWAKKVKPSELMSAF